ncbi:MAG: hypothetical protein AABY22_02210, partial [Nanoarchaeota archaeon]
LIFIKEILDHKEHKHDYADFIVFYDVELNEEFVAIVNKELIDRFKPPQVHVCPLKGTELIGPAAGNYPIYLLLFYNKEFEVLN